ncbi:MAG: hypothetical protein WAN93_11965, partial [Solirubrobacteraceae bacterium]
QKLIRRHPHVFADTEVSDAAEVLRNWDAIKATEPGRERGVFGEVPENLPALLYARKLQRRAASAGLHPSALHDGQDEPVGGSREYPVGGSPEEPGGGLRHVDKPAMATQDEASHRHGSVGKAPQDTESEDQESFRAIGERLFALVDEARLAHVDPELALRAAAQRFRKKIGEQ